MMHDTRGLMLVLFGFSLSLATACEVDDAGDDSFGDRNEADEGDIVSTQEPTGCARHSDAAACLGELGCSPSFGHELFDDGEVGWCSDPNLRFVACMDNTSLCTEPDKTDCEVVCPAIEQTLCIGDEYWLVSGCAPANANVCTAPGELTGECGTSI